MQLLQGKKKEIPSNNETKVPDTFVAKKTVEQILCDVVKYKIPPPVRDISNCISPFNIGGLAYF